MLPYAIALRLLKGIEVDNDMAKYNFVMNHHGTLHNIEIFRWTPLRNWTLIEQTMKVPLLP